MNYLRVLFITTLIFFLAASCQKKTYEYIYPTLNDGKYDSEFPYRNCSEQLDQIAGSVIKVFCLTNYVTYHFDVNDGYSKKGAAGMSEDSLLRWSTHTSNKFDAANGSATLIHYDDKSIALLTCAHVVHSPDSIYTYYDDNDPYTEDFLEGIAVKGMQRIFFLGFDHGQDLEILAMDNKVDIAIIGKYHSGEPESLTPIEYPLGSSGDLEWGSFVYILGYPLGYQMITRGIVSKAMQQKSNYFLIDASFNQGFSGGPVLAIKDGVPNFELVGIGKSASATTENVLIPEKRDFEKAYNPEIPYDGDVYVEVRKNVNYGITKAVNTDAIRRFYKKNRKDLLERGYDLDYFFLAN